MAGALRNAAQTGTQALKFFGGLAVGAFTGGAAAVSSARAAALASGAKFTFKQGALAFAKGALVGVLDYATPYPISYAFLRQAPISSPRKPPSTPSPQPKKEPKVGAEGVGKAEEKPKRESFGGILYERRDETGVLVPTTTSVKPDKVKKY